MTICPDAATLGAFVEGSLNDEGCLEVQRHVADCSECAIVVAQTSRFLEGNGHDTAELSSPVDWRWLVAVAAVATLVLPALLWRPSRDPLRRVKAIAANAKVRTVEGRLDGFVHRPFSAPRASRSTTTDAELEAQRLKQGGDLHARGVAVLVAGNPAAAVDELRRAVAMSPERADAWTDLAAAEIALASMTGERNSLLSALRAADRAITLSPSSPAAYFNAAVAAEHLGLHPFALHAYKRALVLEPPSPWREEARERINFLDR